MALILFNATRYNLSKRELDVLLYVSEGLSFKEIAYKMQITYSGVNRHANHIRRKTNANNLTQSFRKLACQV